MSHQPFTDTHQRQSSPDSEPALAGACRADYKVLLSNGAFKSGSTWLREIALNLRPFAPVPREYARRSLDHWICETRITSLLDDDRFEGPFLSKSHIFFPRLADALLARPNVRVLNIQRDIRDAIVSSYYHFMRRRKLRLSFDRYYRTFGRVKAAELQAYHKVWDRPDPKILSLRFEDLKANFAQATRRLAQFLEIEVDEADIERVRVETSIDRLREKRGESGKDETQRFFRRGAVGDWRDHFSDAHLEDLQSIIDQGLRGAPRLLYWALNPARRSALLVARRLRLD